MRNTSLSFVTFNNFHSSFNNELINAFQNL